MEGTSDLPTYIFSFLQTVNSPKEKTLDSSASLDMKLEMLRQQRLAGSPRRRKASEQAAKEVAGEAKGSPQLVRITRIDSTRRPLVSIHIRKYYGLKI